MSGFSAIFVVKGLFPTLCWMFSDNEKSYWTSIKREEKSADFRIFSENG